MYWQPVETITFITPPEKNYLLLFKGKVQKSVSFAFTHTYTPLKTNIFPTARYLIVLIVAYWRITQDDNSSLLDC